MNKTIITGRMTKDAELRTSNSGLAVANFGVAVDRQFARDGEKSVDFFDCVAFRKTAEFVTKYFPKGKMIMIEGHMQSRDWEDKNGNKRRSWELICDNIEFMGDGKKQNGTTASVVLVNANPFDPTDNSDLPWVDEQQLADLPV